MESRLATYLHPLAGRPMVWHALAALAAARPAPDHLFLITTDPMGAELFADLPVEVTPIHEPAAIAAHTFLDAQTQNLPVLMADLAAPASWDGLQRLIDRGEPATLPAGNEQLAAAWLSPPLVRELATGARTLPELLGSLPRLASHGGVLIRDRRDLARAGALLQTRLLDRVMRGGVTVLMPDTVLLDVDVTIGRDTVIYPGVVLEGQTSIGEETVIGPGCRIIDSWIGSGVEMKGWNYVSRTSVRNRAILEPYVRRGFD